MIKTGRLMPWQVQRRGRTARSARGLGWRIPVAVFLLVLVGLATLLVATATTGAQRGPTAPSRGTVVGLRGRASPHGLLLRTPRPRGGVPAARISSCQSCH